MWQVLAALAVATVFAAAVAQAQSVAPAAREAQRTLSGNVRSAEATADEVTARRNTLAAEVDAERRSRLEGDARGQQLLGSLDEADIAAAATSVIGPGLTVTITDPGVSKDLSDVSKQRVPGSQQVILDRDLQLVVNSLWVSGAEGDIGGRCAYRAERPPAKWAAPPVDNQPIDSPYEILAPGPPHGMQDVFDRSPGLQRLRLLETPYGVGVKVSAGDGLTLPRARFERSASPSRFCPNVGIAALVIGIVLGRVFQPSAPEFIEPYPPTAVVAALDAVCRGLRAYLERIFDAKVFVVSFVFNVLVAALIVYVGDQLGVGSQLSTAIIVVLGIRIFGNAAALRRRLFGA